ncbi:unnamed protein product [marine sediment metagenome]|uniref:B12-binding domain-containing protein n=1 Tax=marine sediment metagenome TaxID=412755 RepID=X1MV47_9ZZZZ
MADYNAIADAILNDDEEKVAELVEAALKERTDPHEIINEGLLKGMNVVGDLFKRDELFVPEVLVAAKAMKRGMAAVETMLKGEKPQAVGRVVMGTVAGDIHDIGKKLVSTMLDSSGFEVIDLGVGVADEEFVQKVRELKPDILGMSALLTTTCVHMKSTIEALQKAGLRDSVKVMVGGSPVTPEYAEDIGADGTAADVVRAVELAKKLVKAA